MISNLRKILIPFSLMYGIIIWLRNKFFDWNLLSSKSYSFPVICVGNLSVGGTGKSPMIEYLIRLLRNDFKVATLSRGYKRKTKGFYRVEENDEAINSGDEPLQFKSKFPNIFVAVDENRQNGIAKICAQHPQPEVILLDDAFQHRKVKPGFSVLLTSYDSIYPNDLLLPAGNLRENKSGANRADLIVVTKCPPNLSKEEQQAITAQIRLKPHQQLYFSHIAYANSISNKEEQRSLDELPKDFCLITGIAKPQPLVEYLKGKGLKFKHQKFPDHHNFSTAEVEQLQKEKFILTTEKDFMRLQNELSVHQLFYLPIRQKFIAKEEEFNQQIINYVKSV